MKPELTKYVRKSGCASKIPAGCLADVLCGLDFPTDENTMAGITDREDAGVYRITDKLALVQTIDFSTPTVNEPRLFGRIAAANALSDIYAMGVVPKTALNIVCFSVEHFGKETLREILRGGAEKLKEAGVSLLGGHSVDDAETKFGLSVTGITDPEEIIFNKGAKPGDLLILTKPLGNGIISTGVKEGAVSEEEVEDVFAAMEQLNDRAGQVMRIAKAHAATDVTGFGLIGHLKEMIQEDIGVELDTNSIPCFANVAMLASKGIMPGGLMKNRDFYEKHVTGAISGPMKDILYDPQTSGGLLIAIAPDKMETFRNTAKANNLTFWVIGKFQEEPKGKIVLR